MTEENNNPKNPVISLEMVRWWEKKRLIYNSIIVPMTVLTLFVLWENVGVVIDEIALLYDAFWMLVWSNVLYTSGWVGGILRRYYLGTYPLSNSARWFLFILGTIFSALVLEVRFSTLVNPLFVG